MKIGISGTNGFLSHYLSNHLKINNNFEIVHFDLRSLFDVNNPILEELHFFIHLSQPASKSIYENMTEKDFKSLLDQINRISSKLNEKVIFISSSAVYGFDSLIPHKEDEKIQIYDKYSEIKIKTEKIVLNYGGYVIRLANILGPNKKNRTILWNLNHQIKNKIPIVIKNNFIRDYLDVNIFSEIISKFLLSKNVPQILNIGSGVGVQITELIDLIAKVIHFNPKYEILNNSIEYIDCSILDVTMLELNLNYKINQNLELTISKILS